jgi:HK97 family phage major capsid protein
MNTLTNLKSRPIAAACGLLLLAAGAVALACGALDTIAHTWAALVAFFTGHHFAPGASMVMLALAPLALTEDQVKEFRGILDDMRSGWPEMKGLPAGIKAIQEEQTRVQEQLADIRRREAARISVPGRPRQRGMVSDDTAELLACISVVQCLKSGCLEALSSVSAQRDALIDLARKRLNVATRAALTTTEIPLPAQYGSEMRELTSEFGVVRRAMAPYPIGLGTARPARMGTRPAFGSVAMSAPLPERSPAFSFASLESHKIGGIVRLPRELDEQSMVPIGQFLARYGAVEFARAEDTWGFLADGTGTYENVKGVVQIARDTAHTHVLAATKTKPSDATLEDFRTLRTKVNKAALNGRISAYYLDSTWETRLPAFRTQADPNVYQRLPDGTAVLDGYPVIFTDVLTPYGTAAAPDSPLAIFGALSFWLFGEHGSPRIDPSEHVFFANDQLAIRFIEEIDFDYVAEDATAALVTAAA